MNKMWEPEFDNWEEDKVTLSSCELSTNSMSRGEYGVMMPVGDGEDSSYAGNAAIFWTDETHLYLRYDWDQWYKISTDDPVNCANICKRGAATLLLCTNTSIKSHAVKVYHLGRLPEELFGKEESDESAGLEAIQLDLDFDLPAGDDETP